MPVLHCCRAEKYLGRPPRRPAHRPRLRARHAASSRSDHVQAAVGCLRRRRWGKGRSAAKPSPHLTPRGADQCAPSPATSVVVLMSCRRDGPALWTARHDVVWACFFISPSSPRHIRSIRLPCMARRWWPLSRMARPSSALWASSAATRGPAEPCLACQHGKFSGSPLGWAWAVWRWARTSSQGARPNW